MSRRYSLSAFMLLVLFLTVISSGCKGRFVPMDLDDASMAWADYEGAVYDFLINDVKQAENIMTVEKIDERIIKFIYLWKYLAASMW